MKKYINKIITETQNLTLFPCNDNWTNVAPSECLSEDDYFVKGAAR